MFNNLRYKPVHSGAVSGIDKAFGDRYRAFPLGIALGCLLTLTAHSAAVAELPVPCAGGCSNPNLGWVHSGSASLSVSGNNMQIDQHSDKTQLNWQTFNIGAENTVRFVQPSTSSVALNRVFDPNVNPSRILGNLIANGQVYLINPNGIVFGEGAKVDVHSLVASTLDIDSEIFERGISKAIETNSPAFADEDARIHIADQDGNPVRFQVDADDRFVVDASGNLIVDPAGEPYPIFIRINEGAELNGGKNGRVMIFAPTIENDGNIFVPDGQAILAAGNKVYLQTDRDLRGFLVEVDVEAVSDEALDSYRSAVNAANENGSEDTSIESLVMGNIINRGTISTPRGNINLAGLAIKQLGTLSATTAVNTDGRIRLMARDNVTVVDNAALGVKELKTVRAGHIQLGENSNTEVQLDSETANVTEIDANTPKPSIIELMASVIELEKYSKIAAPSGEVLLTAINNPTNDLQASRSDPVLANENVAVHIDGSSSIDVAGVDVELPMERNVIEVELRGNELADSPYQRDGVLYGEKVFLDVRTFNQDIGEIPVAYVKGAVDNIKRTNAERNTEGGNVVIRSLGSVSIGDDATINVSGGAIHYQDGYINTTHVVADGRLIELSKADPALFYDRIEGQVVRSNTKWNGQRKWLMGTGSRGAFEEGYIEGKDAGSIQINAYNAEIRGNLVGHASAGRYQRDDKGINDEELRPSGGTLIIGDPSGQNGNDFKNYVAPHVVLTGQNNIDNLFNAIDSDPQLREENLIYLSTDIMQRNGFDHLSVFSNGKFLLNENLTMNPGGSLNVLAREIEIADDITIRSGDINLLARDLDKHSTIDFQLKYSNATGNVAAILNLNEADLAELIVRDDVALITEGLWANDSLDNPDNVRYIDYSAVTLVDGGDINVKIESDTGSLNIGANVALSASAGAWLNSEDGLTDGKGGDITIGVGAQTAFTIGENLQLSSFALENGGKLALAFPEATLVADAIPAAGRNASITEAENAIEVPVSLFQSGGFSHYRIESVAGSLTFAENIHITPRAKNYVPAGDFRQQPNNQSLSDFASIDELEDYLRQPVSIELVSEIASATSQIPVVDIAETVSISTDPGASISVATNGRLIINGNLSAPAGTISVLTENRFTNLQDGDREILPFDSERSVVIGSAAQLSTRGTSVLQPNEEGLRIGEILDGGVVEVQSRGGFLDLQPGARIDVSGNSATFDIYTALTREPNGTLSGGGYEARILASDAGRVNISASEGLSVQSEFIANTSDAKALGGQLSIRLDSSLAGLNEENRLIYGYSTPGTQAWTLRVNSSIPDSNEVPAVTTPLAGQGLVVLGDLPVSGMDSLSLFSSRILQLEDGLSLNLDRSIAVNAPIVEVLQPVAETVSGQVQLNAPHVLFGNTVGAAGGFQIATGPGKLVLGGDNTYLLELNGSNLLHNVDEVSLVSQGDIRLLGANGGITVPGDIHITANQLYAATLSNYSIISNIEGGVINVHRQAFAADPVPVISAGGSVNLQAHTINQGGIIKAPLGTVNLTAINSGADTNATVNLLAGSVTQTTADVDLIPFGETIYGGNEWRYVGDGGINSTVYNQNGFGSAPMQNIVLQGDAVDVNENAILDFAGRGELVAYEFLLGPGGRKDVTSAAIAQAENTYALIPSLQNQYAPYDAQIYSGWNISPDLSIRIDEAVQVRDAGGETIALNTGVYPLLPARFALLPGALLVTAENGYTNLTPGQNITALDGAPVVSGRFSVMNTSFQDQLPSGFSVRSGSFARLRSEYQESYLSGFLGSKLEVDPFVLPRLPGDAGQLNISASNAITLEGIFVSAPAAIDVNRDGQPDVSGYGADVNISSSALRIVAEKTPGADAVELSVEELEDLGAESLLLGGSRAITEVTDGDQIREVVELQSVAETITFSEGAELTAPEIILVTRGSDPLQAAAPNIWLQSGSAMRSSGSSNRSTRDILLNGDGAMVRVSENRHANIERVNTGTGTASVVIERDARLASTSSIIVESSADVAIDGEVSVAGGSVTFGAAQINLGLVAGDGLNLTRDFISNLAMMDNGSLSMNQLILSSVNPVSLNDSIGLDDNGDAFIGRLQIDAAGVRAAEGATDSVLVANEIQLSNSRNTAFGSTSNNTAGGRLTLLAQQNSQTDAASVSGNVYISDGEFMVSGYDELSIIADQQIIAAGAGGVSADSAVTLETQRLTALSGADLNITAVNNSLVYNRRTPGNIAVLPAVDSLGGRITLAGSSVAVDAPVVVPSGMVSILADGQEGDVVLNSGAEISVAGITRLMGGEVLIGSWGGEVTLSSENGLVNVRNGARIDVSGANADGSIAGNDAGAVSIVAGGARRIDNADPTDPRLLETLVEGTLLANAQDGYYQGRFSLDVNNYIDPASPGAANFTAADLNDVEDFAALNQLLNQGGFTEARVVRVRNSDLVIGSADTHVDIVTHRLSLTADQGAVEIANTLIDATGSSGGRVEIYARDDLTVHNTTQINANATAIIDETSRPGAGKGGTVLLSSEQGNITVQAPGNQQSHIINVAGTRQLQDYQGDPLFENGQPVMANGSVHFRLPRTSAASLNIQHSTESIINASTIDVEAFQVYDDNQLASGANGKIINRTIAEAIRVETETFMTDANSAPAVLSAINTTIDGNTTIVDNRVRILPGVEIRTDQTLSIEIQALDRFGRPAIDPLTRQPIMGSWDLLNWKYGPDAVPGVLTIRTTGELRFAAGLTDGFETRTVLNVPKQFLDTRESWSYRLAAGSDTTSANPNSILATSAANLTLASGKSIRTGTGDININVAGDLVLTDGSSTIFTSGVHTFDGAPRPVGAIEDSSRVKEFPTNGGDIRINTRGDIRSLSPPDQMVVPWMWRQGGGRRGAQIIQTEWAVDIGKFQQGVAAFGGGDIDIQAGGTIDNVSFSIPTTGIQASASQMDITRFGGGDLTIRTVEDFKGGALFADAGNIYLQTGGGLLQGERSSIFSPVPDILPTFIILGDGSVRINASRGATIGAIASPMVVPRTLPREPHNAAQFFTYTDSSTVTVNSLLHEITLQPQNSNFLKNTYDESFVSVPNTLMPVLTVYPPNLYVNAFSGDINVDNEIILFPSRVGNLGLVAENNINSVESGFLYVSDANPLRLPSPTRPFSITALDIKALRDEHNSRPLHEGDHVPVHVIANKGNISGNFNIAKQVRVIAGNDIRDVSFRSQNIHPGDLSLFYAGRDIRFDPAIIVTNYIELGGPGRLDLLAGRHIDLGGAAGVVTLGDLRNPALADTGASITVMPGIASGIDYQQFVATYIKVHPAQPGFTQAMRDFSGNQDISDAEALAYFEAQFAGGSQQRMAFLVQQNLTEQDIGVFHDIVRFDEQSLELAGAVATNSNNGAITPLQAYRRYQNMDEANQEQVQLQLGLSDQEIELLGATITYQYDAIRRLNLLDGTTLTIPPGNNQDPYAGVIVTRESLQQFASLSEDELRAVVFASFFNELLEGGRYALDSGTKDYSRGFNSIEVLFPETNEYDGDLTMYASRIYTLDSGDINILVPGGFVNGGLAQSTKAANQLGVVAQREGSINTYSKGDFIVNQSRVFTLYGGDILMWSSYGDIDAGGGAKTAIAAPEPNISFDAEGNVIIDFAGAIAGSGIRAIAAGDVEPGNVYLFAPNGTINAGDAGIAGGDIYIGALEVIGAENIDISGVALGVPTGDASVAGSLSGATDVGASASKSAEDTLASVSDSSESETPLADAALSYLEVFVIGLGEESAQTDNPPGSNGRDNN